MVIVLLNRTLWTMEVSLVYDETASETETHDSYIYKAMTHISIKPWPIYMYKVVTHICITP